MLSLLYYYMPKFQCSSTRRLLPHSFYMPCVRIPMVASCASQPCSPKLDKSSSCSVGERPRSFQRALGPRVPVGHEKEA